MILERKTFSWPANKTVTKMVDVGFWLPRMEMQPVLEPMTFEEVKQTVLDFAESIGPERLVNICELTSDLHWRGDNGRRQWVVYYWQTPKTDSDKASHS